MQPKLVAVPKYAENFYGDVPDWAYSAAESILESLKAVDPMTYFHCLRVGEFSYRLARACGLNQYQQKVSQFAGLLHDVGKMGIEQAIVHKPGKLTPAEYTRMQEHSLLSEEIIKPLAQNEFFAHVLPAVRGHHERLDGRGYPDKLNGDNIPVVARVILIVDTLDAMAQDRPYRMGMPLDKIYDELEDCSGTQFDSQLVEIFLADHPNWSKQNNDIDTLSKVAPKLQNLNHLKAA